MLASNFITESIPPIRPSDSITTVLDWMGEFKVTHLPVVEGEKLLGIISEHELLETPNVEGIAGEMEYSLNDKIYVYEDSHIYDAIKLMELHKIDTVPVLSVRDNHYLGLVNQDGLLAATSSMLNISEPGGVIVVEVAYNSYSLSELGRIAESSEAKVLSLTVETTPDPTKLNITLKLNLRDLSPMIATLERFEYHIVHVIFDTDQLDDYRERYENLIRYLSL